MGIGNYPGWFAEAMREQLGGGDGFPVQAAVVTATQSALTDNSGGTASTTLADITESNNAGSADRVPTENAIASLAARLAEVKVDIAAIISALQTANLMATS